MPKFLKDNTIALLDGGIEAYLLALQGMTMPSYRMHRKAETKYAPVVGLYGASAELLVKACLVQANGISAMYKDGNITSGTYRFGSEVITDLRRHIKAEDACISFIWEPGDSHTEQLNLLIHSLNKFKLLQELRASGLHAGLGCSRDIAVSTATDVYSFIQLLSRSKKLKPYLRNIPAPEPTIHDREAIIEDFTRRLGSVKDKPTKASLLRNMYLVLPYIPEMQPDWVDAFDRIAVAPPTDGDLSYLAKTLSDAHSIYLLKNKGGKDGVPVRIEPGNPNALPIAIQNIKRTLNTTPDKFNNDVMTANTRLNEKRLDLPIDGFIVDLYALGLNEAQVLTDNNQRLTAQQVWPFVASAYSTNGTPRPCWFIIHACDDINQLISYMKQVEKCGNGYLKRRMPALFSTLQAYKDGTAVNLRTATDSAFKEIRQFKSSADSLTEEQRRPFTPTFLRKYPLSNQASTIISDYIAGSKNAGNALSSILELETLVDGDRKAALVLLSLCVSNADKNGLVSVLRTDHLKGYISKARKIMFFLDFIENGPQFT